VRKTKIESIETEERIHPKRVKPSIDIEALTAETSSETEGTLEIDWTNHHYFTQWQEIRRVDHSLRVLDRIKIVEEHWKDKVNSFKQVNISLGLLHKQLERFVDSRSVGSVREQEALNIAIGRLTQDYKNLALELDSRFEQTLNINL
jgi:hypothetical protein